MKAMRVVRMIPAAILTLFALAGMALLSAAPVRSNDGHSGRLRLSWSARPERIETCRVVSKEELEEVEEHMRQRVECEGKFATYALDVFVDEHLVHRSVVRGAGLRNDRPIFLLREIPVPTGTHKVRVSLNRREKPDQDAAALERETSSEPDSGLFAGRAQREAVEHARRARAAIPARLGLERTVQFQSGQVVIVTFEAERGSLALLSAR